MKLIQKILIVFSLLMMSSISYSITCVQPDWDDQLCNLEELQGKRCANAQFFRTYCEKGTDGCEKVPGGCIGATPINHWYTITNEEGVPKARCRCGCFASETLFARGNGQTVNGFDIMKIYGREEEAQFTVSSLDSFDTNSFTDRQINSVVFGPESESVLSISTDSGKKLVVSNAHPLVLGDKNGKLLAMKAASEVNEGDYLISREGEPEQIKSINKIKYNGQMVNFNVFSDKPENHVVEANGLLAGDQGWQDKLSSSESRVMWRNEILKFISNKGVSK